MATSDTMGNLAESFARFFGTAKFLSGMTIFVVVWVALNSIPGLPHFDPYPFILLTLILSLQASYAAPLILLADARQQVREQIREDRESRMIQEIHSALFDREQ